MIPVETINPNPPPMPAMPPGVQPPQAPQQAQPPAGAAPPAGPPQEGAGAMPAGAPPPQAGTAPPPGASAPVQPQPGELRPRLIPGTDETSGDIQASAQEEGDYQQLMIKIGKMVHSRESRDQVLSSLHDPSATVAQAVGRTAASLIMAAEQQKQAAGKGRLSHDVLQEAARYVIPELMDVGIAAGILPLKPPEGVQQEEVGEGDDPYNREIRMALLEATKVYGEAQLKRPDAAQLTEQAGNDWAEGVRQEVADGTASKEYLALARPKQTKGLIPTDDKGATP